MLNKLSARQFLFCKFALLLIGIIFSPEIFSQPVISGFSPASGPAGTLVTISGGNFSDVKENNIVFFGGIRVPASAASSTSLVVTVPKGSASQPFWVTTGKLTAVSASPFIISFPGTDSAFLSSSFQSKVDFDLSGMYDTGPSGVYLFDFDGDGMSDVLIPNNSLDKEYVIMRNISSGGEVNFAGKYNFRLPGTPSSAAVSDFDGDGKPDFAITTDLFPTLSFYKNSSTPGSLSFSDRMLIESVTYFDLVTGDFDGDGKPDLVASSVVADKLVVYKNTTVAGEIKFVTASTIQTGRSPSFMTVGDIDGDGKPDILATIAGAGTVCVYRNITANGVISFAPKVEYSVGTAARDVAIADLDKDGKVDVLVTNDLGKTLSIFRNTSEAGSVSLAARLIYPTVFNARGLRLEDLDGDGDLDVAISCDDANVVSVYKNISAGGSIAFSGKRDYATGDKPFFLAIGDLNGDGRADIVSGNKGARSISVLQNSANAPTIVSFTPGSAFQDKTILIKGTNLGSTTAVSLGGVPASSFTVISKDSVNAVVGKGASGDLLLTTPYGTAGKSRFIYQPSLEVISASPLVASRDSLVIITGTNFNGVTSVRFGGVPAISFSLISSTQLSAKVGNGNSGSITVETPSAQSSLPGFRFIASPYISGISPLTGNIGTEITIRGKNFENVKDTLTVFIGDVKARVLRSTDSTIVVSAPAGAGSQKLSVTVNNFTCSYYKPFQLVFPGAGATVVSHSFAPRQDFNPEMPPGIMDANDIDGDGWPDIAVAGNVPGATFYRNASFPQAVAFYGKVIFANSNSSTYTCIGELDGDGRQDVVLVDPVTQTISIYRNTSTAGQMSFAPVQKISQRLDNEIGTRVLIADLDGDGKGELIVPNEFPNTVSIYRNVSSVARITFSGKTTVFAASSFKSLFICDLNQDGKPEIIIASRSNGIVTIYKNNSTPGTINIIQDNPPAVNLNSGNTVCAGDLDGDGRPEIIFTNQAPGNPTASQVTVFKNNSTGTGLLFGRQQDFPMGGNAGEMATMDLDGDGKLEVVVLNGTSNSISVFKNTSPGDGTIRLAGKVDYPAEGTPAGLVISDFNRDGKPDMAVSSGSSNVFSVFLNRTGLPVVTPAGANPVTGEVVSRMFLDSSVQTVGNAKFVARHYDITAKNNPATATAKVKLLFMQSDFDKFNAGQQTGSLLPRTSTDETGKAAIRIYQYHGNSEFGTAETYDGNLVIINPDDADITWNAEAQWWEVSFDISGFSGFFLGTENNQVLPLKLLAFTVARENANNHLKWKTTEEKNLAYFEVQRSLDGRNFNKLSMLNANKDGSLNHEYSYLDLHDISAVCYYRLKMADANGEFSYSEILAAFSGITRGLRILPNPVSGPAWISHPSSDTRAEISIFESSGKLIRKFGVYPGAVQTKISGEGLAAGLYRLVWESEGKMLTTTLVVK